MTEAKIRAVQEGTTLTELIIQGLRLRLDRNTISCKMPVSSASGGMLPGLEWEGLHRMEHDNEEYR